MEKLEIKVDDKVKFDSDSLFVQYGTVKRVNKLTYGITDESGNYVRIEKNKVWWD